MAIATIQTELPLLTAGLPRLLVDALRLSGLPVRPYLPGTSIQEFLQRESGRYVLYDSRRVTSRLEAETALGYEREIIDVAPESQQGPCGLRLTAEDERRWLERSGRWIERFRACLESRGGVWCRVHELPSAYEGVVFVDGLPRHPDLQGFAERLQYVSRRDNASGAPHFPADHVLAESTHVEGGGWFGIWWSGRSTRDEVRSGAGESRVWFTTEETFRAWWNYRNSLSVQIRRNAGRFTISSAGLDGTFPIPVIEYWRENHVARIPLTRRELTVAEDKTAFACEAFRRPAGLIVSQGHSPVPASGLDRRRSATLLKTS